MPVDIGPMSGTKRPSLSTSVAIPTFDSGSMHEVRRLPHSEFDGGQGDHDCIALLESPRHLLEFDVDPVLAENQRAARGLDQ